MTILNYFLNQFYKISIWQIFYCYSINRAAFETLRSLIVKIFPREPAQIYYTPAFKSQVARGKLYSAYTYYRRQLGAVGLIDIRTKSIATSTSSNTEIEELSTASEESIVEDIKNKLTWLEENAGPIETVAEYWESTRSTRLNLLKNQDQTTFSYLTRFLALDTISGYKLVCINFYRYLFMNFNSSNFFSPADIRCRCIIHRQFKYKQFY